MIIRMRVIRLRSEEDGIGCSEGYDGIASKSTRWDRQYRDICDKAEIRNEATYGLRAKESNVAGLSPVK